MNLSFLSAVICRIRRHTGRIMACAAAGAVTCFGLAMPASAEGVIGQKMLVQMGNAANMCALTFDDGPGAHTPRLLDLLRKEGIRATFFLLGDRIRRYPRIARRIAMEGHEVGNHSASHMVLRGKNAAIQHEEIARVQNALKALGVRSRLLRPPYGSFDSVTLREAEKQGLVIALWTVDSQDWQQIPTADNMVSAAGNPSPTRGIFLMHDIHETTIDALLPIIEHLRQSGCRFVTVSEYLGDAIPELEELPISRRQPGRQAALSQPSSSPSRTKHDP